MVCATVGLLYSCSSAETATQKKAESKKSAAAQATPQATAAAPVSDSLKTTATQPQQQQRQLVVYYFMTTYRCPSCHYIEETTRAAINENFAEQLKSGRMVFKMLNVEEPANEHFAKDYQLYTKSVVLSDTKGGKETRWTNLDKVWQLIHNDRGFEDYIVKEVKAYLGE
jgi:thiol-disulfide isomerase/thioredoxin